jgi:hypothetical protein
MIAFTPFDGDKDKVAIFAKLLFDNGVIGFVAGSNPTRIRFLLPAAAMSLEDVDPIMDIVEMTLKQMAS